MQILLIFKALPSFKNPSLKAKVNNSLVSLTLLLPNSKVQLRIWHVSMDLKLQRFAIKNVKPQCFVGLKQKKKKPAC